MERAVADANRIGLPLKSEETVPLRTVLLAARRNRSKSLALSILCKVACGLKNAVATSWFPVLKQIANHTDPKRIFREVVWCN